MRVRAVGEKSRKQYAIRGESVEMRGDVAFPSQCANMLSSKALHQYHDDITYREDTLRRQGIVSKERCAPIVDQGIVVGQQHLAYQRHRFSWR